MITSFDLFCGAGGLATGLKLAGIQPLLAADSWSPAAETFKLNHPNVDFLQEDLAGVSGYDLISDAGEKPTVVAGGPPCQGFTSANRRGKDSRNSLVGEFARIAAEIQPEIILFENVEGFLTTDGSKYVFDLIDPLLKAGYNVRVNKYNVANFGVPQLRKRVIVMASLSHIPSPLVPTHSAYGSPGVDLIGPDLPPTRTLGDVLQMELPEDDPLHHKVTPTGTTLTKVQHLKPGQGMADLPPELQPPSWQKRANRTVADGTALESRGGAPTGVRRLREDEPSKTITRAATEDFIHPTEDRRITLREAALIQTFPPDYQFVGNNRDKSTLIGNAIPPQFGQALGEAIKETLQSPTVESPEGLVGFDVTASRNRSPLLRSLLRKIKTEY